MKICSTKKRTKQNKRTKKTKKKSVPRRESNPGLPTYKRDAVSVAPRQLILNIRAYDKLIIFNAFADEILPVDTVWNQSSVIYEELKDIFEENKHGFDSQSCTLTHFVAFEEHMADKCLAKPSRSILQLSILRILGVFTWRESITIQQHFSFYCTKKHFISEWYFTKNHEIGSLVVRKVKRSCDSRQNRELEPASLGLLGTESKSREDTHSTLSG